MIICGYKGFNGDRTNRYGMPFEEGKSYQNTLPLRFGNDGNGFHMCTHLSDVYRFFGPDIEVAEVISYGEAVESEMDDWMEPYYGMYTVSDIYISKFLTREEIIEIMCNASASDIVKFFATGNCNVDEASKIMNANEHSIKVVGAFLYYIMNFKDTYSLNESERIKKLEKVYKNGQNSH